MDPKAHEPDAHPTDRPDHSATIGPILAAAARGDENAWAQLIRLYGKRVFALCRSRLRDPHLAEEVTQSVMVTVAAKLKDGQYSEQGRFEAWLFRIAVNRVRDEIRRSSRSVIVGGDDAIEAAQAKAPTSPTRSSGDDLDALRNAMALLPEIDRQVVELRHHAQLSFNSIAEMLEEPLGTLLARHHRALKKLKDLMTNNPSAGSRTARAEAQP